MKRISFSNLLYNMITALLLSVVLFAAGGVNPVATFAVVMTVGQGAAQLTAKYRPTGVAFAGLLQEIWIQDIQEQLFAGNDFVLQSVDHSGYINYNVVNLPQSGTGSGVTKNRTTFPATASQRTDTILSYPVDQYSVDPFTVANLEEFQISYNKRQSVMGQNTAILADYLGMNTAYNWAPSAAGSILRTTGANTGALPHATATGTRLAVTLADIRRMAQKLDNDKVPQQGRILLMPVDMYYEIFNDDKVYSQFNTGNTDALTKGAVRELYGFMVYKRATTLLYSNASTPVRKAVGASAAATDNNACIAWHPAFVARAQGNTQVFSQSGDNGQGDPLYYGVIMSAVAWFGASPIRTDGKGIVSLVQAAGS